MAEQRRDLLKIVDYRYDTCSIILTSRVPIERWYELIGEPNASRCFFP